MWRKTARSRAYRIRAIADKSLFFDLAQSTNVSLEFGLKTRSYRGDGPWMSCGRSLAELRRIFR